MLQLGEMQVETALFFETVEQIYARVFRTLQPRTPVPHISVHFRKYANANSRIKLAAGLLQVDISDLLEGAPAPIQEALATILVSKLYRRSPEASVMARYRRYLNRADVLRTMHAAKQQRGRKLFRHPRGRVYDLCALFEELNLQYFNGLMARPDLGWSLKAARSTLGHYDPAHNVIVLTSLLDSKQAPELAVKFVMFHEMLHLRFPTQHRGSRRCVHTREFKQAEKQFQNFEEARLQLRSLAELAA